MTVAWAVARETALNPKIAEILAHLKRLEDELEQEITKTRELRGLGVQGRRVSFGKHVGTINRGFRLVFLPFLRIWSHSTLSSLL
jgi:hypothetical protein